MLVHLTDLFFRQEMKNYPPGPEFSSSVKNGMFEKLQYDMIETNVNLKLKKF